MTSTPDPMPQDFTKSQDFKGFASPEANKRKGQKTAEKFDIDLDKYTEFVDLVTSDASKSYDSLIERYEELHKEGCKIERLDTAASGMVAEAGEFMELVKKIKFQGKPWNDDVKDHLVTELGDVMWYCAQAAMALDERLAEVIFRNTVKLASRYPEGEFSIERSETRKEGDR